jgi:hypothetical protein
VSKYPSLQPAGDWVSLHLSLSARMREEAVAGCLSILSFQHAGRIADKEHLQLQKSFL